MIPLLCGLLAPITLAQQLPSSPSAAWNSSAESSFHDQLAGLSDSRPRLSPNKVYSLAELIDLAEQHNPATRIAWEQAKQGAAQLGVARSALFPVLTASAELQQSRGAIYFGSSWYSQDISLIQPAISLLYTVFDFGRRSAQIDASKSAFIAANFSFNQTHEQIIYDTTAAYYQLLNARGQVEAAKATLANSQTSQQAVEERLKNGLATLPDALEARAATAQAAFDLETARGAERVAFARLAQQLNVPPTEALLVEEMPKTLPLSELREPVEQAIHRALIQRPDLLSQAAEVRAASSDVTRVRANYFPDISFSGSDSYIWARGAQPGFPPGYGRGKAWKGELDITWTIFDGRARYNDLDRARSRQRQSQAQLAELRNRAEVEVWTAYSDVQTALLQNDAAAALLTASDQSYNASLEAYKYGVKNFVDVVTAQRVLAQARFAEVQARTQLMTDLAGLAFRTGDLLNAQAPPSAKP